MFWVELTFKGYEDTMILCVSIFIFLFRTNGKSAREQLDENDFRHCYGIFFESIILKLIDQAIFRNNYKTLWQRHLKRYITVKDFTDMDHHINDFFLSKYL